MSEEAFKTEMIQVGAVATAILMDWYNDTTKLRFGNAEAVFDELYEERERQEAKWGPQHHDPLTWLMILMEEVGEAAREIDAPEEVVARSYHRDAMKVAREMESLARSYLERMNEPH